MTTIAPIETVYAGCRFRSRLEARWAVFFDSMGIRWEYEPQGFILSHGRYYLPDFYLPDCASWVEVKGQLNEFDLYDLRVANLELPQFGRPIGEAGPNLILLGPIPDTKTDLIWPDFSAEPFTYGGEGQTDIIYGEFERYIWQGIEFGPFDSHRLRPFFVHSECENSGPWSNWDTRNPSGLLIPKQADYDYCGTGQVTRAYAAARRARFEHGEGTDRVPCITSIPEYRERVIREKVEAAERRAAAHPIPTPPAA